MIRNTADGSSSNVATIAYLMDLTGKIIKTITLGTQSTTTVDVAGIPSGTYFIRIPSAGKGNSGVVEIVQQ